MRRFAVGTAAVAALSLSLTGCLGSAGEAGKEAGKQVKLTAAEILGKSAQNTSKVDTFSMNVAVDSQVSQAAMTMKMKADVRLRPTVAMHMTTEPTSVQGTTVPGMEMIMDSKAMYMKMAALSQANGGKPWSKVLLSDLGAMSGMNLSGLMDQAKKQSPAEQTKMLTASKDAREVGTETVDGVKTRHFTGTVQLTEALGKLDAETRAAMEKQYQQIGASSMNFDIWVGDDDLPRKMVAKIATAQGPMTTTAQYSDYGKQVDVSPPPASEVGPLKLPGTSGA